MQKQLISTSIAAKSLASFFRYFCAVNAWQSFFLKFFFGNALCLLILQAESSGFSTPESSGFNPDKYSTTTLNSFGVSTEFLSSLRTNTILQSASTDERWARFVQQFESSYEFIPIIRSMIVQSGIVRSSIG